MVYKEEKKITFEITVFYCTLVLCDTIKEREFEEENVQLQRQHLLQPAVPQEAAYSKLCQDKNSQNFPRLQVHPTQSPHPTD
jgi:hypothetical protein